MGWEGSFSGVVAVVVCGMFGSSLTRCEGVEYNLKVVGGLERVLECVMVVY